MFSKGLALIVTIVVSAIALYCSIASRWSKTRENFAGLGVQFKPVLEFTAGAAKAGSMMGANVASNSANYSGNMFTVPGVWQSQLPPRIPPPGGYSRDILYNMPDSKYQAVPQTPLGYADAVKSERTKENYTFLGNQSDITNYTAGNYADVQKNLKYTETTDKLPVSNMNVLSAVAEDTGVMQPIVYNNFMYANTKSRLWAQQDMIRGSLPIVPVAPGPNDWFRPSVRPNIDLNAGAMAVMAGANNDTAKETLGLMRLASGGTTQFAAGVPVTEFEASAFKPAFGNPVSQKLMGLSASGADVQVTAFP